MFVLRSAFLLIALASSYSMAGDLSVDLTAGVLTISSDDADSEGWMILEPGSQRVVNGCGTVNGQTDVYYFDGVPQSIVISLGGGNDSFQLDIWYDLEADITADTGSGSRNSIRIQLDQLFAPSSQLTGNINMFGGDGDDSLSVLCLGQTGAVIGNIQIDTGNGENIAMVTNCHVDGLIVLTGGDDDDILGVAGYAGADLPMVVQQTVDIFGFAGRDYLGVAGFTSNDDVTIDAGDGWDTIELAGIHCRARCDIELGTGDDVVTAPAESMDMEQLVPTPRSLFEERLRIRGGDGNKSVILDRLDGADLIIQTDSGHDRHTLRDVAFDDISVDTNLGNDDLRILRSMATDCSANLGGDKDNLTLDGNLFIDHDFDGGSSYDSVRTNGKNSFNELNDSRFEYRDVLEEDKMLGTASFPTLGKNTTRSSSPRPDYTTKGR